MQQQHVVITKGVGTSINPGGTESAAQTTWMNDGFIVNDPILSCFDIQG